MNTLYATTHGLSITKSGGRMIVKKEQEVLQNLPVAQVNTIVISAVTQVSHAVIVELLHNGGNIIYMGYDGSIMGELSKPSSKNRMVVQQLNSYNEIEKRQQLAKDLIKCKLENTINVLRTVKYRDKSLQIARAIKKIRVLLDKSSECNTINSLMGIEGMAAKIYFQCFPQMILNDDFLWKGRRKHPAPDPINAMLSFGYALLEKDIRRGLSINGFNIGIGFLHELDYRKDSLVFDIMEVFRAKVVDKLVLNCINLKKFKCTDFEMVDGRCLFTKESRNRFIREYEITVNKELDNDKVICEEIKRFINRFKAQIIETT